MRVLAQLALVLLLEHAASASHAASAAQLPPDDDPKCARGECLPARFVAIDEDDPKLARGLAAWRPTPRIELSYRFLQLADPFSGGLTFHLVEIDGFPVSGIFRLGLSLAAGAAPAYSAWMATLGISVGVQYPARVTPFLDVRFTAGALGVSLFNMNEVSYVLTPAIEAGIAVPLYKRFHFVVAVGWAHPIYGGVDGNAIQAEIDAKQKPIYDVHNVAYDMATVRAGFGF